MFDTFISYRREGGQNIANRVYDFLKTKNFSPFYDIEKMGAGRFDEQIRNNIIHAENFLLILSKGALDRCSEPGDWVLREIELAIENNLNIVVFQADSFEYPDDLPSRISLLKNYQVMFFSEVNLSSRMELLVNMLTKKKKTPASADIATRGKKLEIAGEYITQYEDLEDGKIVMRKAPATLKKFFNTVVGETYFGSHQAWKIKAKLYGGSRMAGIYFSKNSLDNGFGTFFLEIKSNSLMEGFWSGYDNENNTVVSGKYLFRKKFSDYIIRPIEKSDCGQVVAIAEDRLGKDYITYDKINGVLNENEDSCCLVAVDKRNGKVISFSLFRSIDYNEVLDITRQEKISELRYAKKIGYLATVATRGEYENYGITTSLVKESLQFMKKSGTDAIISTAWKHAGKINIGGILERVGFEKRTEIARYWYDASIKEGFDCPACGNPCRCSCVIYTKI